MSTNTQMNQTPTSRTSSSVMESTQGDAYEDIFDRLDSDLPVLLLSTTEQFEHDDGALSLDSQYIDKHYTGLGKKYTHMDDQTSTETHTYNEDDRDIVEKCEVGKGEDFYSLVANQNDGSEFQFEQLKGKYVLITNVASMCGFSWQLTFLNEVQELYKDDGLVVLGFPSNNFCQEWFNAERATACYKSVWNCHFKIMEKIRVNGKKQHQVFRYLKDNKKGFMGTKRVKWNFEKFLVDRNGTIIRRYSTLEFPYVIKKDLDEILKKDRANEIQSSDN